MNQRQEGATRYDSCESGVVCKAFEQPRLIIGIDAVNLRHGGGCTHMLEMLRAADPIIDRYQKIVVWAGKSLLAILPDKPWLQKVWAPEMDGNLAQRTWWQIRTLSKRARAEGCGVLFVPGGSYSGSYRPVVSMSQNLLPFEIGELRRYGLSAKSARLHLLRFCQARSFRRSDGIIFLTEYAREAVLKVAGPMRGRSRIIAHGVNDRFFIRPRMQNPIEHYSASSPMRLIYVSIVDAYKHQWSVVEAVAKLRGKYGWALQLEMFGPANAPAIYRLEGTIKAYDPGKVWARYCGPVEYAELHKFYARSDVGVFASSCENLPNILIETMAAGLPIACSSRGPMPEVLGDAGTYFDPEDTASIAAALEVLIISSDLRTYYAQRAFDRAQAFSWKRCARETFDFLTSVHCSFKGSGYH